MSVGYFSFASEFAFEETTISMQFYFEQANTIFKSDSNFIVGAFVQREHQLICIGGTATIPKPTTMGLFIYGQDNEVGTALEGEKIIFAGMNIIPRPRCEMILTPIDKEGNEVDVFFHQGAIKKAHTWKNETVSFEYPSIVCGLKNQVSPPITTNIPAHSVSIYKSNNSNLLLNVSTGGILSEYSPQGTYKINWKLKVGQSDTGNDVMYYCIEKDTFEITLVDTSPILTKDFFSTEISECEEKAMFKIDTSFFNFDFESFVLKNEKETFNLSEIETELPIGNYESIEITDKNKCVHPVTSSFKIMTQGNCDENYVLMPFTDNGPQEISFEQEGELKIVDQQGNVVKKMIAPIIWNGRMSNGKYVDMGIYFIYNKNEYIKTLHVYR